MSALLDQRGRIGGRINVIDLVAVVLLAALAAFVYLAFSGGEETATVRTTFVVSEVRNPTVEQLEEGTVVYDLAGNRLGILETLTITPTPMEVPTADGGLNLVDSALFFDVTAVVRGEGRVSSSSVRVGNVPLRVGKWIVLVGQGYEVRSQVWGIEVEGE